jgi:hypothetical protein
MSLVRATSARRAASATNADDRSAHKPARRRSSIATLCALALLLCVTNARTQTPSPTPGAAGAISGRIITEDGQPLAGAQLFVRSTRRQFGSGATTDADGKFNIAGLERGLYDLLVFTPGFYDPNALDRTSGTRYRPGDSVTIRLQKGGVITGRVTDSGGTPLIAVRVSAVRIKDQLGRAVTEPSFLGGPADRVTDDRGIYRLYGLPPGTYLVNSGGRGPFNYNPRPTPYDDDAPTYYPSTTRDAAAEIVLLAGQEATDIDIRHRGETGHAISGTLPGPPSTDTPIIVQLIAPDSFVLLGFAYLANTASNELAFTFDSLADGDYDLVAERLDKDRARTAAASLRVTVRGADVTGLRLTLAPLASVAGRVVLEAAPPAAAAWPAQCRSKPDAVAPETLLRARRERTERAGQGRAGGAYLVETAPDDKGAFTLAGLAPGRFRFDVRPPTPDWYVRAVTPVAVKLDPPVKTDASTKPEANAKQDANAKPEANAKPAANTRAASVNPFADGLTLAAGTRVTDLTVTLAPGAAELRGRVVSAGEGASLPPLQLFLVPAERERADDPLRYAVADLSTAGAFVFTNLAPGRYRLLARADERPRERADADAPRFDAPTRERLRRQTEAAETIELQPCQRLTEHVLRYNP